MHKLHTKPQLAIFGGSFNPVTRGHLKIVAALLKNKKIGKIVIIPCGDRKDKPGLLPGKTRVDMLQLALEETCHQKATEVVSMEAGCFDHPHRLFIDLYEIEEAHSMVPTSFLLQRYNSLFPQFEVVFVLGSDLLSSIHTWEMFDEYLRHQRMIVFLRSEAQKKDCAKLTNFSVQTEAISIVSSTIVRETLARFWQSVRSGTGGKWEDIREPLEELSGESVARFILRNKLFSDSHYPNFPLSN